MEKNYEIQVTVKVTEDALEDFLSNAIGDVCGCAWWKAANQADYDEAKAQLVAEGIDEPCLETVWARMLLNGKKLRLLDPESEWHWSGHKPGEMLWKAQIITEGCEPEGGEWHDVGIEDLVKGLQEYGRIGYANKCRPTFESISEDGDFYDADAVVQIAMYGEVIYG